MHDAGNVGVVVVEAVAEETVHGRRVAERQGGGHAEYRHIAFTRQRAQSGECLVREIIARGGLCDAGGIEHVMHRANAHDVRDLFMLQVRRELCQDVLNRTARY